METTPSTRLYAIPMLFCEVVSTTAIKTQTDFAPRKISSTYISDDGCTYILPGNIFISWMHISSWHQSALTLAMDKLIVEYEPIPHTKTFLLFNSNSSTESHFIQMNT